MDNKNNWSGANNILTELHIIIGHDRTHLSIDASGQDNMTCHVTAFTYSRSLRALKALVRYRNTYGQYHASARPIKCKDKI